MSKLSLSDVLPMLENVYKAEHTAGYLRAVIRCAVTTNNLGIEFSAGQWIVAVTDEQLSELYVHLEQLAKDYKEGIENPTQHKLINANVAATCLVLHLGQKGYMPQTIDDTVMPMASAKLAILVVAETHRRKGKNIPKDMLESRALFE